MANLLPDQLSSPATSPPAVGLGCEQEIRVPKGVCNHTRLSSCGGLLQHSNNPSKSISSPPALMSVHEHMRLGHMDRAVQGPQQLIKPSKGESPGHGKQVSLLPESPRPLLGIFRGCSNTTVQRMCNCMTDSKSTHIHYDSGTATAGGTIQLCKHTAYEHSPALSQHVGSMFDDNPEFQLTRPTFSGTSNHTKAHSKIASVTEEALCVAIAELHLLKKQLLPDAVDGTNSALTDGGDSKIVISTMGLNDPKQAMGQVGLLHDAAAIQMPSKAPAYGSMPTNSALTSQCLCRSCQLSSCHDGTARQQGGKGTNDLPMPLLQHGGADSIATPITCRKICSSGREGGCNGSRYHINKAAGRCHGDTNQHRSQSACKNRLLAGSRQPCSRYDASLDSPVSPHTQQLVRAMRQLCSRRAISTTSPVCTWNPCKHCGRWLERTVVNRVPAVGALEPQCRKRHRRKSGRWVVSSVAGGVRAEAKAVLRAASEGLLQLPCRSTAASRARQAAKR
jgi:hypothetical protein